MLFIYQILISILPVAFEGILKMIGGADLVFGKPFPSVHAIVFDKKTNDNTGQKIITEPGTISYKYLDVMIKTGQIDGNFQNGYFIHIPIINKQKSRADFSKAKNVNAKIFYYDENGESLGDKNGYVGRWKKLRQPYGYSYDGIAGIDIPAGEEGILDIAVQPAGQSVWLAWNNQNYIAIDYSENKIGKEKFIFNVKINGENIYPKEVSFTVCRDKNGELILTPATK